VISKGDLMDPISFRFDSSALRELGLAQHTAFVSGQPFPNVVIDDFLPKDWLDPLIAEFPKPHTANWQTFDNGQEKKLALSRATELGEATQRVLGQLHSAACLEFLETLTGIDGLIPDPYLVGGGLHQIERGGFLKVHADFNWHEKLRLERRLNLIVYLNRDWRESYGGDLQLWDAAMTRCVTRIHPVLNRAVIFSTFDTGYHGHPDPLTCPEGETRKSLALYYYTNGHRDQATSPMHSTLFQARPGETLPPARGRSNWKSIARRFIPPIVTDYLRSPRK
jgi:Rps23 Pro-64 3,4-dihydroxylase Tpa1-like proline 4-hydroxylase